MIDTIKGHNLFSWEDLFFRFSQGVTLVEGFNFDDNTPEGAGKSAIPNIVCWTLYGQIPKDAKIDQVVREGEKSGWGEAILLNGTVVRRSRKPNDLYLQPKGATEPIRGKDARETQQLIEAHIGMGFETFCHAVYFAQNYPNKFITANEAEKGKIISEIQDLGDFIDAKKLATKKETELESNLEKLEDSIKTLLTLRESYGSQKLEYLNLIESLRNEKIKVMEKLDSEATGIQKELNILYSDFKELNREGLNTLNNTLKKDVSSLEKNKRDLQLKLSSADLTLREIQRLDQLMQKKDLELTKFRSELENFSVGTFDESAYSAIKLSMEKDLEEMQTGRSGLLAHVAAATEVSLELSKLQAKIKRKQQALSILRDDLKKFESTGEKLCPTCGSVLDKEHAESHKKDTQDSINSLLEEIRELNGQLKTKEEAADLSKVKKNLNTLDEAIMMLKKDMAALNQGLLDFERARNNRGHLKEKINSTEQELEKIAEQYQGLEIPDVAELKVSVKKVEASLGDLSEEQTEIASKLLDLQRLEIQISGKEKELKRLQAVRETEVQKDTKSIEAMLSNVEAQISSVANDIENLQKNRVISQKLLGRMRTLKESFQEVKAYVFRSILSELTKKTNRFLVELFEVPVSIIFANEGEDGEISKILAEVTMDDVPRALGLYSGGQFRRIQLAVDLALSEIIASRSYNPANIRIFDEPFKDLSESSMEKALKLFETLKGSTLLIEHNTMVKSIVNQVFRVELRDKVSREVS